MTEKGLESSMELGRRLREADAEELGRWLETVGGAVDAVVAQQVLLNPFVTSEQIVELLSRGGLRSVYAIRRAVARHPRTPQVHALQLVGTLFWRDLLEMSLDTRIQPAVRRAAERRIVDRLPAMTLGERMSLARRAGGPVMTQLRHDAHPRVIAALLENPRLTVGVLMPLVSHSGAAPEILKQVAADRRWGVRHEVRLALCRNPRTPPATALRLLTTLRRQDLRAVSMEPRASEAVRRRARELLSPKGRERNRH